MSSKFLHLITSHVPDRYAYNGAADTYWKIIAFQKVGITCILHIINKPSAISNEIQTNCNHIHFYERTKGHATFSFKAPFRVNSLFNQSLLKRLLEDTHPLYFDQIDTTSYLKVPTISNRLHFIQIGKSDLESHQSKIRTTNSLSIKLLNLYKSFIYHFYSKKVLCNAWIITSPASSNYLRSNKINNQKIIHLLPFIGLPISKNSKGKGSYCLFHGDFKDNTTNYVAFWLLDIIFKNIDIPFVVAGKNVTHSLEAAAHREIHTCMVADPTEIELNELISKSQICIHFVSTEEECDYATILSMQYGRHILKINETDLKRGMENEEKVINSISQLFGREFDDNDIEKREQKLNILSQDETSARRIKEIIDGHCQ